MKWKKWLSTSQDVFINELQRRDMERKDGNLRYRQGSSTLLSSNTCCTLESDPRAAQKAPSPPHWTRAATSVWLRPQCILCLPCAELEREQWSCPHVATGLMTGHLSSPLASLPETCQALLRISAVGECCAHKLVSIRCQNQSRNCHPKYTLSWTFLSPLNNQGLWPQRESDIKAVMPGPEWSP